MATPNAASASREGGHHDGVRERDQQGVPAPIEDFVGGREGASQLFARYDPGGRDRSLVHFAGELDIVDSDDARTTCSTIVLNKYRCS